jgi:quercetin dioxygenase-like cupin family protein
MRYLLFLFFPGFLFSQTDWGKKKLPEYDNIYSEKISEDSLHSTFFIAIKKHVLHHYHKEHSECIVVLSGKGEMTLGEQSIKLRQGMQVSIPKNIVHSVVVLSKKPLRVISIQSPMFDGKDRHFPEGRDF